MGGASLPTPSTPGYTSFRNKVACDCLAQWLPWLEKLCIAHGYIKQSLDIIQLTGGNPLSAGTHSAGGAFDLWQFDTRIVALAREMGAWATWMRPWTNNHHTHGVLAGCAHNGPAAYQLTAVRKGGDGLGSTGMAGADTHPAPKTYRTWAQGIAWAKTEVARLTPKPVAAPAAAPQEIDLKFTDIIPGTNPPITVGQALVRGAYAYGQVISTGSVAEALARQGAALNKQASALGAVAADVDNLPEKVKEILQDAAVSIDVSVKYPQAPAEPA